MSTKSASLLNISFNKSSSKYLQDFPKSTRSSVVPLKPLNDFRRNSEYSQNTANNESYFPGWLLKRKDFQKLLTEDQSFPGRFLQSIAKPYSTRASSDHDNILNWLKHCKLTKNLKDFSLLKISKNLKLESYAKGRIVLNSSNSNSLGLIVQGRIALYKNNSKSSVLGPRSSVGGIKYIQGYTKNYYFKALTDVEIVFISEGDLYQYFLITNQSDSREIFKILKSSMIFNQIFVSKLQLISDKFFKVRYEKDEVIYNEGEDCNQFFILKEGEVELQKNLTLTKKHKLPIKKILISKKKYNYPIKSVGIGEFFGLEEILYDQKYFYSSIAKSSRTIVFSLPKLGMIEEFSSRDIELIQEYFKSKPSSREIKRQLDQDISNKVRRIKTIVTTIEQKDVLSTRDENKKRTWMNGVTEYYTSQSMPRLVSEQIEFKETSTLSSKRNIKQVL